MAQSSLSKERIVAMFPTMANLRTRIGVESSREWGLLQSGKDLRFGLVSPGTNLIVPFSRIYERAREEFSGLEDEDTIVYYELNEVTMAVHWTLLDFTVAEAYQLEVQTPPPLTTSRDMRH